MYSFKIQSICVVRIIFILHIKREWYRDREMELEGEHDGEKA